MEQPIKYGLIGEKLRHSFSKKYFSEKFDKEGIDSIYLNYELSTIQEVNKVFQEDGLKGLNVTIPYKESIIQYLDEITGDAAQISAVNTIQFKEGRTIGHNTDTVGFRQMIKPFFKSHHERAMILGTGGAAKAVKYVLEGLGCSVIDITRTPKGEFQYGYDEINENMIDFNKLIINTTPLGMYPNVSDHPDIPFQYLTKDHLVIDLIYNPEKTNFLEKAEKQTAVILNGKTMLEQQAEAAWKIWNE